MKKILYILIITTLVLLSGCSSDSTAKESGFNLKGSFKGGSDALKMEFTEGQPPAKVRDGGLQPFTVRVLVSNLGEYDIAEGVGNVVISGVSYDDFGISKEDARKSIPALRGFKVQGTNTIDGAKQPVMFSNLKYIPQIPSGVTTQQLSLDICYPYRTEALASLCISGNTLRSFDNKLEICTIEGTKKFANSGAPVQIENVKESAAGQSSIQVQFDIVHKKASSKSSKSTSTSNGRIFKKGSLDSYCKVDGNSVASTQAALAENYVTYSVVAEGLGQVNCGSSGTNTESVLLSNGKISVYCTIDTTGEEDYEKPVYIYLDYDYFDRITKTVQIEHVDR